MGLDPYYADRVFRVGSESNDPWLFLCCVTCVPRDSKIRKNKLQLVNFNPVKLVTSIFSNKYGKDRGFESHPSNMPVDLVHRTRGESTEQF